MLRTFFKDGRALALAMIAFAGPTTFGFGFAACTSEEADPREGDHDAAPLRRDAAAVDGFPSDPGVKDAGTELLPSCSKYCDIVMANCVGPFSQYETHADCMAFCDHLQPGMAGDRKTPTLGCRLYWAGNPARTDPSGSCWAAGPFGGGICGDRCQAFCTTTLSACSPDDDAAVFASQPECADACLQYAYRDASTDDGGGETPEGPKSGDTLNCRLYHLRTAVKDPQAGCPRLRPTSGVCR